LCCSSLDQGLAAADKRERLNVCICGGVSFVPLLGSRDDAALLDSSVTSVDVDERRHLPLSESCSPLVLQRRFLLKLLLSSTWSSTFAVSLSDEDTGESNDAGLKLMHGGFWQASSSPRLPTSGDASFTVKCRAKGDIIARVCKASCTKQLAAVL